MRYRDLIECKPSKVGVLDEDASAGATCASNVAVVSTPFMADPKPDDKKKRKKHPYGSLVVVKRT